MSHSESSGTSLREAFDPAALRAALIPSRPVFANPWESTADMFACYVVVAVFDPLWLWLGGRLMGSLLGVSSRWHLGVFIAAAVVGAAGFMTIVGRQRTRVAVDVLAIAGWVVLGLIVAPILGLELSALVAIIVYALMLLGIFAFVLTLGQWQRAFIRTVTWPTTWSFLAAFFAFAAYRLILFH